MATYTILGLARFMASKPTPSRSISPGAADSITKSAFSARDISALRPSSEVRSSVAPRCSG